MSGTALSFRTPGDVRAIPNATWDAWYEQDTVPWRSFSAERWTQRALREIVRATGNRRRA
jgi:hypothetical protein